MRTTSFQINDASTGGANPAVWVTITEENGVLAFSIAVSGAYIGDLRGFFFDVADERLLGSLAVGGTSAGFTELRQGNDTVTNLGDGANMSGLTGSEGGYDVGLEIGTAGIGRDDYQTFSFTLSSSARPLTLEDLANVDIGVRLTSVGTVDGSREDSSKILEHTSGAVDARDDAASVNEGAVAPVQGNLLQNDAYLDAVRSVVSINGTTFEGAATIVGAYGTLTVLASGAYSYALDNTNPAVGDLSRGELLTEGFAYVVRSWNEATSSSSDSATLTITIVGTNADPVITSDTQSGSVVEDAAASAGGTITFRDEDFDPLSVSFAASGTNSTALGTFSLGGVNQPAPGSDGAVAWSYALDNAAAQALAEGDSHTEVFHVTVRDGQGGDARQEVVITITGTNDAALVSSATVDVDETDSPLSASGILTISDVDGADEFVAQAGTIGAYGTFSIDDAGAWSYSAASPLDELNAGDTRTDTFEVRAADGTPTSVSVSIHGTNDAAVLPSAAVDIDESDAPAAVSGILTADDVDNPDTFVPQAGALGVYGTFSIDSAGAWVYGANAAFDELNVGDTRTDAFAVRSADGTTTSVTINIHGTNDAPVLAAIDGQTVDEDAVLSFTVAVADVDTPAASLHFSLEGEVPGGASIDPASGEFNWRPAIGQAGSYVFDLVVADGGSPSLADRQTVQVTVHEAAPLFVSIGDANVLEGAGPAVFAVNLSRAASAAVTVNFATQNGRASAPTDFTATSGALTFAPGETSKTIVVPVAGDFTPEGDEFFYVNLAGAVTAVIADGQGFGSILDNDLRLAIDGAIAVEGDSGSSDVLVRVLLSAPSSVAVTVDYATLEASATAPADFIAVNGTLEFAPGETVKTFSVPVVGDMVSEGDEAFRVRLSNSTNAVVFHGDAAVKIVDNAPLPRIAVDEASVIEGHSGARDAVFTVFLSHASSGTVSVEYRTIDGSALAGSDYSTTSGTLVFAPGETSKTIAVPVLGDGAPEPDESFQVMLSGAANAILDPRDVGSTVRVNGAIVNDDPQQQISIVGTEMAEGNSGSTNLAFTVLLSDAMTVPVTVSYVTENTSAVAGSDYTAVSGTLTFNPGETAKPILVPVLGDTVPEADESFRVRLLNPVNASLQQNAEAPGWIMNDELVLITVGDALLFEGDSGTSDMIFTVKLSAASSQTVSVHYATENSHLTAPEDYTAVSGTLTFAPGETTKTVAVPVVGDTEADFGGFLVLRLTDAVNAQIADVLAFGQLLDDERLALPALTIDDATLPEGDGGTTAALLNVRLSAASNLPVTVNYSSRDSGATAGADYGAVSGMLTFAPGETHKTISVDVFGDTAIEADESVIVFLSGATNVSSSDGAGFVRIINDEPLPHLAIGERTVFEGDSGTIDVVFTVVLSAPSTLPVTVEYHSTNFLAAAPQDFTAVSGTLTFAPGETTKTLTVAVVGDTLVEGFEQYSIQLRNPTNAFLTFNPTTGIGASGVIIDYEVPAPLPRLTVNDVALLEGDDGIGHAVFTVTRAGPLATSTTVSYAAVDGNASAGADYSATSGSLIFGPGETTKSVMVPVLGDGAREADEMFFLNLTSATNAEIADNHGVATIFNDDARLQNVIAGEAGSTILSGSAARERFDYDSLADGPDTILNFDKAGGDALDILDVLHGLAVYDGTNAFSGGFLQFVAASGNTDVMIDADGSAGAGAPVLLATLTSALLTQADTAHYIA